MPAKDGPAWPAILFNQFKSPLVYILIIVSSISLFFKEYIDASLILAVIILNAVMGFFQEYSAQKTLSALQKILKPKARVMRDGRLEEIEARFLVPGDIVMLHAGDRVPADGQVIKATNLLVNEAILTGEEEAVLKTEKNKENLVFMGTTVISGRGQMQVEKIGRLTEIGKIGVKLAEIEEEKTPLQIKLGRFTKNLAIFALIIFLAMFLIGLGLKQDILSMFKLSVILSVAVIPEGLPVAITVILALGMRKILKRNGLVKSLVSIETLGSTSVICTDKTGTLTEGIMKVVKVDFPDINKAMLALTLANERKSNLEISLWEYVKRHAEFDPEDFYNQSERIYEEPFDSAKKYNLSINRVGDKQTAFIKGAPEIVLKFCQAGQQEKDKILAQIENWTKQGLKVLGLAVKEQGKLKERSGYVWLGLVGIEDPLRKEVKDAVKEARQAGIKIKIVTGDHKNTAIKVAENLGLNLSVENIIEGAELEALSEKELARRIEKIYLFARITPLQKLRIVEALQKKGEIVAMTGDGVNDALALKKADIGVVVGSASDVAKEASDLVLLDSNFKTIVAACEEGRLIFSNIKKVVAYVLSNSFAVIVLIFGALLFNLPAPLTVVQILWIQLICDGPPDIMLGFEPKDKGIMKEKPKDLKKENILSPSIYALMAGISLITGLASLLFFWYYLKIDNLILARTVVFATMAIVSLVYIFSFKNLKKSVFQAENFWRNKYLFLGSAYGILLIFAAVYLPWLNRVLGTTPLALWHWLIVLATSTFVTLIVEIIKLISVRVKK